MSKRAMEKLRGKLCEELDKIAEKPELSTTAVDGAFKITCAIKNIDKITEYEENGYSGSGMWEARGDYGRSYGYDGMHSGRHRDSMGRYARGMFGSDSSYGGAHERMMTEMEEAMAAATSDREREVIRKAMESLKG